MLEKDAMDILMKFLDKKVREAEEEVTQKGTLSDEKAIPLILKTQFNHIAHLETEIADIRETMDRRFGEMRTGMDRRFERLERNLFGGFAFLAALISVLRFVRL